MSRSRPSVVIVISAVGLVGATILLARLLVKPSRSDTQQLDDEGSVAVRAPNVEARAPGSAKLAITVPAESGFTSVSYAIVSADRIVVARGNSLVEKQTGAAAPPAIALPSGKGYRLSVVGNLDAGGTKRATYLGSGGFDVAPGHETPVSFSPNADVDRAAGELAGAATPAGTTTAVDGTLACQSCELSSGQGICASENVTATSNTDPQTGEQTGVGWGCSTLVDGKAKAACVALLHCLNSNGCEHPGENPVTGCYCGAAPAEACIGGQGITGACIAEYQAAAMASAGGPTSGAGSGQLSQFITTASGDPTTPVGLADNIRHCAMETHCEACQTL